MTAPDSDYLTIINSLMHYAIELGDQIQQHQQWRDRHPLAEILDPDLTDDYGNDPPPPTSETVTVERFHQLVVGLVLTAQKLI